MKQKKVIVTGGAGFIGSHLVRKLVEYNIKVVVIDNFLTGRLENLEKIINQVEIVKEDINHYQKLTKRFIGQNIDCIFHIAALPRIERSIDNPIETHSSNVGGIFSCLELSRFLGVRRFIFTSSSSVYGDQKKNPLREHFIPNPQNPYAAQKLMGEIYSDIYNRIFKISTISLRLFNVYGIGMDGKGGYKLVFTKWLDQIKKGLPLTIYGDGKQTRDFTHVSDVVAALIKTMKLKIDGHEIINIGAGRQVSVKYLASLFKAPIEHIESRKFEERFKQADISKARKLLNWKPTVEIEKGVMELLKHYTK